MRKLWLSFLGLVLALSILNSAYAPVRVNPVDIFDQADNAEGHSVPAGGYEAGRRWVGLLASPQDGGVLVFDWERWGTREVAILILSSLGFLTRSPYPIKFKPHTSFLAGIAVYGPALVYAAAALYRALYVPCVWSVQRYYPFKRIDNHAATLALWVITDQRIRYDLILFEEFVMFICVCASTFPFSTSSLRYGLAEKRNKQGDFHTLK